jgi:hypothetical protein
LELLWSLEFGIWSFDDLAHPEQEQEEEKEENELHGAFGHPLHGEAGDLARIL